MRRLFASVLIVSTSLAFVAGCGGASTAEGTTPADPAQQGDQAAAASTAALVPWKDAVVGDHTTCAVSNEEFVVTAESAKVEHEGHTYYFCCPGCIARFQENPAQYLTAN